MKKELKNINFVFDPVTCNFVIEPKKDGVVVGRVTLNKVYSFAFARFVIRMSQKGLKRVKEVSTDES